MNWWLLSIVLWNALGLIYAVKFYGQTMPRVIGKGTIITTLLYLALTWLAVNAASQACHPCGG